MKELQAVVMVSQSVSTPAHEISTVTSTLDRR